MKTELTRPKAKRAGPPETGSIGYELNEDEKKFLRSHGIDPESVKHLRVFDF